MAVKDMSNIDIDLVALAPQPIRINTPNGVVESAPISTINLFKLYSAQDKYETKCNTIEEFAEALKEFQDMLSELVPELKGLDLTIHQCKLLVNTFQVASMPLDAKALKENGIEAVASGDEKKDDTSTQDQ